MNSNRRFLLTHKMKYILSLGIVACIVWIFLLKGSSSKASENNMNQNIITVEVWSDVVCPFCLLGKKKLERAVEKLEVQDQVEITFRSFQLDPNFPEDSSLLSKINLVQRKGYPATQVEGMCNQLTISGKEYDIQFDFDKAHTFNTLSAHRLIHWAKQYEKANDLKEAFMVAHFSKGVDLASEELLLKCRRASWFGPHEGRRYFRASDSFLSEVQNDLSRGKSTWHSWSSVFPY
jgi:predicted DsbA family dithiol-disulfide isomerase